MQRIFIKKCFLFTVGSVCRVKRFTTGSRNSQRHSKVADDARPGSEMAETAVKRLLCYGFQRTGKVMGQLYPCWWRICREIKVLSVFEYHMFYVLSPFVTCLWTLMFALSGQYTYKITLKLIELALNRAGIAQSVWRLATGSRPRVRSSSPGGGKTFFFSMASRPALGSTQSPIQWEPGAFSPGVKQPGREADHSPATSAEIKKTRIYTSTSPYVFMA
jgi:hypothetical protein